ncbi:hypothetical protein [Variovorax terrae]|uniref:Uncharacterized protein n=1 Tax=Variovorax terrae TaxID=2923278 RepID=A0A9X1VQP5_9BURK|nr:hypothetical protein [Variovorax terrae]MCJ0761593.1 hypothetical protein [Variovorax terrae]
MSTETQHTADKVVQEYSRINETIMKFFWRQQWTIPMGAMLVSGILPSANHRKVPKTGRQLKNPNLPASPHQLRQARDVVERWIEDHTVDSIDGAEIAPTESTPLGFVIWCDEYYTSQPKSLSPSWLDYFLGLFKEPKKDAALVPAPILLVERAQELEKRDEDRSRTDRVSRKGSTGRVCLIENEIRIAQRESRRPLDPYEVYDMLKKLAQRKQSDGKPAYSRLRWSEREHLQQLGDTGWKNYSFKALQKFIDPQKKEKRTAQEQARRAKTA